MFWGHERRSAPLGCVHGTRQQLDRVRRRRDRLRQPAALSGRRVGLFERLLRHDHQATTTRRGTRSVSGRKRVRHGDRARQPGRSRAGDDALQRGGRGLRHQPRKPADRLRRASHPSDRRERQSAPRAQLYGHRVADRPLDQHEHRPITGTATKTGNYSVTVTATDGTASGSTSFSWTVTAGGVVMYTRQPKPARESDLRVGQNGLGRRVRT